MLSAYARARRHSRTSSISTCPSRSAAAINISPRAMSIGCCGAGYNGGFTALEDAVERYVKGFLDRTDRFR